MKYQTQKTSKTSLLSSRKIPISLDEKIIQVSKHLMESFLFKEEGFKELDTNCSKPIAGQANFQQSFTKGKILSTLETYQLECQPVGYSFLQKSKHKHLCPSFASRGASACRIQGSQNRGHSREPQKLTNNEKYILMQST